MALALRVLGVVGLLCKRAKRGQKGQRGMADRQLFPMSAFATAGWFRAGRSITVASDFVIVGNARVKHTVSNTSPPPQRRAGLPQDRRRAAVERMAAGHLASLGGTFADTVGAHYRQRLVWLSLLAMPLLFPLALPGMATAVGFFCLLVAVGLGMGRSVPLPAWLGRRELHGRVQALLIRMVGRVVRVIARLGQPRLLSLTHPSARVFNGFMLSAAGLSMMLPVPIISFDNVLPALAIVLVAWGLRLRDGLMLLAGHLVTLVALASVVLLWWGGTHVTTELLALAGLTASP